jgi:L-fuconate dehydratase
VSSLQDIATFDVRFPTSTSLDGSDAMNPDPDYSAAYLRLGTDTGEQGHGFVFTIGRGNDVQLAGVRAVAEQLQGQEVEPLLADMGTTWRRLVHDSQLRWLGPEKGVIHMAIGAVVNALWDLKAKRAGRPLWLLLSEMSPAELVDLVDFRYLTDALTPGQALEILEAAEPGRAERRLWLEHHGYPAYTTTPGWLGYDDEKLVRLSREAVADGFEQIKLKVGSDLDEDVRRLALAREAVGPDIKIAVDANQRWDVEEAIAWTAQLARFDLAWVEEPTSPDDVLGHARIARGVAPVPVATGEHMANRVIAKQLLQAGAIDVLQIDATRVAGVNENVANLLLAARFGVRVCPHAGGVGLCEAVQHLSMFDFVAVSGSVENRYLEYVDHLHEHFVVPTDVHGGG